MRNFAKALLLVKRKDVSKQIFWLGLRWHKQYGKDWNFGGCWKECLKTVKLFLSCCQWDVRKTLSLKANMEVFASADSKAVVVVCVVCLLCVCHTGRSLAEFDTPLPLATCGKPPTFSDLHTKNISIANAKADTKDLALFWCPVQPCSQHDLAPLAIIYQSLLNHLLTSLHAQANSLRKKY